MPVGVTLCCVGRFHHFHLARQLEKHGLLNQIVTGFPRFQLRDEKGIPPEKIRTFPWLQAPYMAMGRLGWNIPARLAREWQWQAQIQIDAYVGRHLRSGSTLIALSGGGLKSGKLSQREGGRYICDRGSSHIRFQARILNEEYDRWKLPFAGIDPRMIEREEAEYAAADYVSVPSTFVADSFVKMGYPPEKLFVNPYGARLERFSRVAEPARDSFTIIFVGHAGIRKGFLYLLDAFARFKHPRKQLKVIGSVSPEIEPLLRKYDLNGVQFLGMVPNAQLASHYSSAHVMVLPSIEEGLAMVIGEALACGCPVIASENTGGRDFFSDGVEGFLIPPRSASNLLAKIDLLAGDQTLREKMSEAALARVVSIGGWDTYGLQWLRNLTVGASS